MTVPFNHKCSAHTYEPGTFTLQIQFSSGEAVAINFCPGCADTIAKSLMYGAEVARTMAQFERHVRARDGAA